MAPLRKVARSTATVAVVACAATGVVLWTWADTGMQDLPVGRSVSDSIGVTVVLPTADGIAIGADVRTGQRVVGRVTDMSLNESGASVQLRLEADSMVPATAVASVELPSALGNAFVRLSASTQTSESLLRDGDVIPPSRTELGPQIESALATFGALLSRSGIDQLGDIVGELNLAFGGRSDQIRGLIDTTSVLLAKTAEHQGDFDRALALAAEVSTQFVENQRAFDEFLDAAPRAVAMLDVQKSRLDALFASSTALASLANEVLSRGGLDAMVRDADEVLGALTGFNDRLGSTLAAMNTFLASFDGSVKGDYLVFDGALDIPGTIDKLLTGGLLVNGTPISGQDALDKFLSGGLR